MGVRLQGRRRSAARMVIGASLIVGTLAGCKVTATAGGSPTTAVTTATMPTSSASASGKPAPAGFTGPATGEHYKQFVVEFKSNLEQLLAESAGGT